MISRAIQRHRAACRRVVLPQLIILCLLISACWTTPVKRADAPPRNQLAKGAAPAAPGLRFLIAPMNVRDPLPYELDQDLPVLEAALIARLERLGHPTRVLDRGLYEDLWEVSVRREGGLFPLEPEYRERLDNVMAGVIDGLARRYRDFGALILPKVVFREVELHGAGARWDGVSRILAISNVRRIQRSMSVSGRSRGLSLRVEIFDRRHGRVFRGHGGLVLPYLLNLEENRGQLRPNALQSKGHARQAVALALEPYIPLEPRVTSEPAALDDR